MKQGRKYIEVVFSEDFAGKKAGETVKYEPSLAYNLVKRGVVALKSEERPVISDDVPVIKKQVKKKANEKNT